MDYSGGLLLEIPLLNHVPELGLNQRNSAVPWSRVGTMTRRIIIGLRFHASGRNIGYTPTKNIIETAARPTNKISSRTIRA